MNNLKLNDRNIYEIKCGWGITKAKFKGSYIAKNNKTCYEWESLEGFKFVSYDLKNTRIIKEAKE